MTSKKDEGGNLLLVTIGIMGIIGIILYTLLKQSEPEPPPVEISIDQNGNISGIPESLIGSGSEYIKLSKYNIYGDYLGFYFYQQGIDEVGGPYWFEPATVEEYDVWIGAFGNRLTQSQIDRGREQVILVENYLIGL